MDTSNKLGDLPHSGTVGVNRSILQDVKIFHRTVGNLQMNLTKFTICEQCYPVMILSESSV